MINFLMYLLLLIVIAFAAVVAVRVFVGEWKNRNYICAILEAGVLIFATVLFSMIYLYVVIIENTI